MDVEFIRLEGVVSVEDGARVLTLRLHYALPDGQVSILTGPQMGGLTIFEPEALGHVVEAFLEDARSDLARAGEWLDADEPRDGFVIVHDDR